MKHSTAQDTKSLSGFSALGRLARLGSRGLAPIVACIVLSALSGCGRPGDGGASSVYRIPWPTAGAEGSGAENKGALKLQDIEIRTLTDPEHFSGATAQILVEPGDGGGKLSGTLPVGRYIRTSSGVNIPSDYSTLQAVTVYAHQERLHDLDAQAGAAESLSWPLSLGLDVRIVSADGTVRNNAVYDSKLDSLLIVPYSEKYLPISMSPGILAHEHFHFIFQKIVMSRVPDGGLQTSCRSGIAPAENESEDGSGGDSDNQLVFKNDGTSNGTKIDSKVSRLQKTAQAMPPRVYNAYLLRAMNEGFADYWGWLYSQDDSFLAKSLPSEKESRRLDYGPGRLPTERLIRTLLVDREKPDAIISESRRAHGAYILGTQYARFLRSLAGDLVKTGLPISEARLAVARALVKTLPLIAEQVFAGYLTKFMDPNALLKPLLENLPPLSREVCLRVNDFYSPMNAYVKPKPCEKFSLVTPVTDGSTELVPVAPVKPVAIPVKKMTPPALPPPVITPAPEVPS